MPILTPLPEPVPAAEVAIVLTAALRRVSGGPEFVVAINGERLAAALEEAGFRVVREAAPSRQLTL